MHTAAQNYALSKTKQLYQCDKHSSAAMRLKIFKVEKSSWKRAQTLRRIHKKWCAEFSFFVQNSGNPG